MRNDTALMLDVVKQIVKDFMRLSPTTPWHQQLHGTPDKLHTEELFAPSVVLCVAGGRSINSISNTEEVDNAHCWFARKPDVWRST